MLTRSLPWVDPLEAAALAQGEECWALLYSGQQLAHTGRYSYLALYPRETVAGKDFEILARKLGTTGKLFEPAWFGYLGYELLHQLEQLPVETQSFITLPDLWFSRFGLILFFDHQQRRVTCHHEPDVALPAWPPVQPRVNATAPEIASLSSAMTRADYLALVAETQSAIARGDFYQANITRKFMGEFSETADTLDIFRRLCEASPAAYSAVIRMGDTAIVSSSPEQFLSVNAGGHMQTRPIKGTAPRFVDPAEDRLAKAQLEVSEKDRAENLMIVDLMRNDLARSCLPGSVRTERLFEVSSYATLHHMASTVTGQKRDDVTTLEAIKACFPPGSMTGAPKIRAMEWCLAHEGIRRGVYSGALGWFGGDGSCDLSVVIRTLVMQGNRFEFQVGGGIVADSEPQAEWRETMTKAKGILSALNIQNKLIENI